MFRTFSKYLRRNNLNINNFSSNNHTKEGAGIDQNSTTSNPSKGSNKIKYDYLYGVNPVMTALYSNKRKLEELYVAESSKEDNFRIQNMVNKANNIKLPVKFLSKEKLEKFASHQPHQGIVLKCEPVPYVRLNLPTHLYKEDKKEGLLWIFIDQVTDPQNFGAILRACAFLGADGVLVSEENRCPLTPTVSKTSAGALELMEINCVKDATEFLELSKKENWRVVGTALDKNMPNLYEINDLPVRSTDNIILMLGSEHLGLRGALKKLANEIVYIAPGIPAEKYVFPVTLLDSLNVSVSCGIFINTLKTKMNRKNQ